MDDQRLNPSRKKDYSDREHILLTLKNMRARCYNPKDKCFRYYGAKGVTVCAEWLKDPEAFVAWSLSNGHAQWLSIDRMDNERPYDESNCRWATKVEQANNRSSNNVLTVGGETRTLAEWTKLTGLSSSTISKRLARGLAPEKVVATSDLRVRPPEHGTRARYSYLKCRCDACRTANSAYITSYKSKKAATQGLSYVPVDGSGSTGRFGNAV